MATAAAAAKARKVRGKREKRKHKTDPILGTERLEAGEYIDNIEIGAVSCTKSRQRQEIREDAECFTTTRGVCVRTLIISGVAAKHA